MGGYRRNAEPSIPDSLIDIARGALPNASVLSAFGERDTVGITTQGEDIWLGTATTVPTPADAGDAMEIVSGSANDAAAGTGVQAVLIDYVDAVGNPATEALATNGTTPVPLVDTNVRFVQRMWATAVGSNGVAVGDIDIRKISAPTDIYSMIGIGGNMSLVPHRMVPLGKKLVIWSWHASESRRFPVAFRLRSTSEGSTVYPGVFLFKSPIFVAEGGLNPPVLFEVPALAIVKVSGWATGAGGAASCHWNGILYDV